ncbi:alpha/beta fold hydrolase [Curtobacterium sp. MCLR17_042]|uniref:alpha/beta fold hydrolase n=1 Tax=Curtobacterium sp. MCLR17_042 TaxID=2175626 RepID=UPI000DA71083|nr:alpha/beta fold hydrolase [Curtobacterium sp. MCLR17_042]PZE28362.1 hypothetical protein DEJ02_07820 [Curtobacterium sp. MCLR17_042]
MRDARAASIFTPTGPEALFAVHRAVPIARRCDATILLGRAGLQRLDETSSELRHVELDIVADEIATGAANELVAVNLTPISARVDRYTFDGDAFVCVGSDPPIIFESADDDVVVLSDPSGAVTFWQHSRTSVRRLGRSEQSGFTPSSWSTSVRTGEYVAACTGSHVALVEDRGPAGLHTRVVRIRSGHDDAGTEIDGAGPVIADNALVVPSPADRDAASPAGIHVFRPSRTDFIPTPGPVDDVGGGSGQILVSVFTGTNAEVFRVRSDEADLERIEVPSGRKTLAPNSAVLAAQGYDNVLHLVDAVGVDATSKPRRADRTPPPLLIRRTAAAVRGTVVHLHGGPEAFEIPEPRLIGLPRYASDTGWDWIGLNYPGSLYPNTEWVSRPWKAWRQAIRADIDRAIAAARGPVVLAGWSFGAAVAVAGASVSDRVIGLVIGGVTGALREHANRAVAMDPAHGLWFDRRFDLAGDDGRFFDGISGYNSKARVLAFHGVNDAHCPVDLADEVAEAWSNRGNPWQSIRLPGGQHYASTEADAALIASETQKFLATVGAH